MWLIFRKLLTLVKKIVKSLFEELFTKKKDAQDSSGGLFFGDLSQSEKHSKIKPPLMIK